LSASSAEFIVNFMTQLITQTTLYFIRTNQC